MVDVAILGAGIIGRMAALELTKRGCRVAIFDMAQQRPPASWAGGGILSPLFPWNMPDAVTRLIKPAMPFFVSLQKEILAATDIDIEVRRIGMLVSELRDFAKASRWGAAHGMEVNFLEEASGIQPGYAGAGIFLPWAGSVRNSRLMDGLQELLKHKYGVLIQPVKDVQLASFGKGKNLTLYVDGRHIKAQDILVSAGCWSVELLQSVGVNLPMFAVKGEMLLYRARPEQLNTVVLGENGYLIPRKDGLVLAGSTLEYKQDQFPSRAACEKLSSVAEELWQQITGERLEAAHLVAQWAGLRPGNEKGVPWITRVPGWKNLTLASGHFRNGLVSAPQTARWVADLLTGEALPDEFSDYGFGPS